MPPLKPRHLVPFLLAPALATSCFGFAEIARGSLLLETTGSVMYESYFLGSLDNDPDVLYSLYPSLRYTRRAGRASITANAGLAFNRYDKNTQYDSDDIRSGFSVDLPTAAGSRLNGNFSLSYNETTDVDLVVNDRVASETFSVDLRLNYALSTRMDLSETLSYSSSTRSIYSDQDVINNQLAYTYKDFLRGTNLTLGHGLTVVSSSGDNAAGVSLDQQTQNLSLALSRPLYGDVIGSVGYGHTFITRSAAETRNGDRTTDSSYVSIGIEGPFLPVRRFPKLESAASLSYQQANVSGLGDTNGKFLGGNLRLAWSARETTRLSVDASRSVDLTITDRTTENTRVGGGFDQKLGRTTSLTGSAGYTWSDTRGIDSSFSALDASLNLSRSFNKYLSASLRYTFTDTQSGDTDTTVRLGRFARRDYERHTLMGSVSVTF